MSLGRYELQLRRGSQGQSLDSHTSAGRRVVGFVQIRSYTILVENETETERQTAMDSQSVSQTGRQTDIQTDRQAHTHRHTDRHTDDNYRDRDKHIIYRQRQTDIFTKPERQAGRQTDRHTHRHTDRHTDDIETEKNA